MVMGGGRELRVGRGGGGELCVWKGALCREGRGRGTRYFSWKFPVIGAFVSD